MTPSVLDSLTLSLPDIAELARVQRPVVSMWRRRYATAAWPFPEAVVTRRDQQRFRASEVTAWIERSGLGRNPSFAADVALRAALDEVPGLDADVALDGLTSLLHLKSQTGELLGALSRAEVLDLADEVDPDDHLAYSEIEALGDRLGVLCEVADTAADAAYTPAGALEAVLLDRHRAGRKLLTESAASAGALDVVARIVLVLTSGRGPLVLANPYADCGDLLVTVVGAVAEASGEHDAPTCAVPGTRTDPAARLARRRLGALGVRVVDLDADDAVGHAVSSGATIVAQLPPVGSTPWSDDEVLRAVETLAVQREPGRFAVVLGPAGALVGAVEGQAEKLRSGLLRNGEVRSVVELPAGLLPGRSRERLAIWVLGDPPADVGLAKQWMTVSDLTGEGAVGGVLDEGVVDDLVTDVVAAQGVLADVRAHAFRFTRFAYTSELVASRSDLSADFRRLRVGQRDDGGRAAVRAHELAAGLGLEGAEFVVAGPGRDPRRETLRSLEVRGGVRRISGNRLDPRAVGAVGEVPVVGPAELTGDVIPGERRMDRRTFSALSAARYTEPGDVIFCTAPYPAAMVDHVGLSVVEFPAQVLRIDRAAAPGLVPHVLAEDITSQRATAKRWRTWEVREVPEDQVSALEELLAAVGQHEAQVLDEARRLAELRTTLTRGVADASILLRTVDNA
ncbi:hypothetical protein EQW78_01620 [Oerskovia turbata]|uniref:SAM-dependent DNA methyltransferase n=1 Tax=Oerskovia turbata TaxID=1713 RepID=A0A4Q1L3W8_9CELL|nr:hypothetical protein [Oerskovia turbata]RXR26361.1 hypothetical protein EQW73_08560 [Oerskovia turbata]RXR36536.1 hypothetical protein EQW78_01620 [Oerskovia turbata]TGJ97549.1 hypothetical protein DLJ96_06255 [Actinotalea fermentans ATCC 43279 = JCM 9966 = DSM 3133]